jgi:hemin uptake protein HemP
MNASAGEKKTSLPAQESSNAQSKRSIAVVDQRIDSRELFVGTRELAIAHGAEVYRLRLTAQNKLILTK